MSVDVLKFNWKDSSLNVSQKYGGVFKTKPTDFSDQLNHFMLLIFTGNAWHVNEQNNVELRDAKIALFPNNRGCVIKLE